MKLISTKFLENMNCAAYRKIILGELFKGKDIFSIVMQEKNMKFDEACEWVATREDIGFSAAPEATDSEKVIINRAAKEFLEKFKT